MFSAGNQNEYLTKILNNIPYNRTKMKISLKNQINATAETYRAMKDPFGQGKRRTNIAKTIVKCYRYIIFDNFLHGLLKYCEV
jgi:hypothetical protein